MLNVFKFERKSFVKMPLIMFLCGHCMNRKCNVGENRLRLESQNERSGVRNVSDSQPSKSEPFQAFACNRLVCHVANEIELERVGVFSTPS